MVAFLAQPLPACLDSPSGQLSDGGASHQPTPSNQPQPQNQTPSPFFCLLIILQAKSEVTSRRSNSTAEMTGRSTLRPRTSPPPRSPLLSPLTPLSPTELEGTGRRHKYPGLCLPSSEPNPNHLVAEAGPTPYGLQNSGFQSGNSHSGFLQSLCLEASQELPDQRLESGFPDPRQALIGSLVLFFKDRILGSPG